MKIQFLESVNINEEELLEDKQVKFGGEVNPKYGWCVIYAGGPASGKSSMQNFNIPIVGKKLDVDEFKRLEKKLRIKQADNKGVKSVIEPGFVKKFVTQDGERVYDKILNDPRIHGDESKMSLSDPDYPSVAHEVLDPFMDKVKDSMKTIGAYNNPETLPNIIFDQTSKSFSKLMKLITQVKQYGYKVAIVWVLTDMSKNKEMFDARGNHKGGRKLPPELFFGINPQIINTMKQLFEDREALSMIDDFWVIVNEYKGQRTGRQQLRQITDTNVYHVPLVEHGLDNIHLISKNTKTGKKVTHKKTLMDIIDNNEKYLANPPEN